MALADPPHPVRPGAIAGVELRVRGLVQGVGFRPTVWRIAHGLGLVGEVLNDGAGVLIRAWGSAPALAELEGKLRREPPPLARIYSISRRLLSEPAGTDEFRIVTSEGGPVSTGIVPDAATCPACLSEVLDPKNRRYRYPFTNCTHCGPRLSIVRAIPYDRATTSMSAFPMCAECQAEYDDPADRRFHAEPNACPRCGPRAWLESDGRGPADSAWVDDIEAAAALIRDGAIVAIKGIGGFHLACDATNSETVSRLRRRKRRYHKPFALMARNAAMVQRYAVLDERSERLLRSSPAPIVVLERQPDAPPLADDLTPGQTTLGFMLPYTALHHLLLLPLDGPIVLTSGNASDEPQCISNAEARERLSGIADHWLMHDREIVNRLDDSVVRPTASGSSVLRRARGLAPEPLPLPGGFAHAPRVLALGAELKSTFTLLANDRAIVSQHIGDLEDAATHDDFRRALLLFRRLYAFDPDVIAVDCHPDYLSTQWGRSLAAETGARLVPVLHHHAHVAAALIEHGRTPDEPPVLGIVLDGLGMGENGELWGGELVKADYRRCERLASFASVPLLGGARAMREPWRNAFAHLHHALGWPAVASRFPGLDIVRLIAGRQPDVLARMIASGLNCPPASSAGRLFDAVAAMVGLRADAVSYEGQAAIELETLAAPLMAEVADGYPVEIVEESPIRLHWPGLWREVLGDIDRGLDRALVAARFHRGLVLTLSGLAVRLCREHGLSTVVLSGGVFQNAILRDGVASALRDAGLEALVPLRWPANDGGVSLGQAVIAAACDGARPADPADTAG